MRVQYRPSPIRPSGWLPVTVAAVALLLSACGGGGGDAAPTPTPTPTPQGPITLNLGADNASLPWNKAVSLKVLANDTANRGALTLSAVTTPAHGSAKLVGSEIEYTPTAGYVGADSFSYTVKADDGVTATATVTLKVQAALVLKGVVADGPIANAAVTAHVGGQSITATADAQGAYSLTLLSDSLANSVELTAVGAGAQGKVKLMSSLGDMAALMKLADKDGVLAPAQSAATLISHYSTALSALLAEANGAQPPTTAAQINTLLRQISGERLLDLATAIKLVADKGVALPEGVADTAALVRGTSASVTSFLAKGDAGLLAATRAEVLAGTGLGGGTAFAPTEPLKLVVFQAQLGSGVQPLQLEFQPGGDVRVLSQGFGTVAKWVAAGGEVTVTLGEVYASSSATTETDPITGLPVSVTVRREVQGFKLRQVAGSAETGSQLVSTRVRETVLSGPGAGTVRADGWGAAVLSKFANLAVLPALSTENFKVGDRFAGLVSVDDGSGADILELTGADTARMLRTGTLFNWRVGDGLFILKSGELERSYAELRHDSGTDIKFLLAVDTQDGATRRAREELGARVAPGGFTADAWLYKRWQNGFASDSQYEFSAGGVGNQVTLSGGVETKVPLSWSITGTGALRIVRGSTSREWILLGRRGGTLVVLEGMGTTMRLSSWRINTFTDASYIPAASGANTLLVSSGEAFPLRVNLTINGLGQITVSEYDFHKLVGTSTPCTATPANEASCQGASGPFGTTLLGGTLSGTGAATAISLTAAPDAYGYSFNGSIKGLTWSGTWTKVATSGSSYTASGTFSVDVVIKTTP